MRYIKYRGALAELPARIAQIHYGAVPFEGLAALPIIKAITRGERPPQLDNPPLNDGAWDLMHRCWAHDKRLRPGIRDVVKIMKSWKRPSALSTSTSTFSQSPASTGPGSALGHKVSERSSKSNSSGKQSNGGASFGGASSAKRSTSAQAQKRSSALSHHSQHSGDVIPQTPPVPIRVLPPRPKSSRAEDEGKMSIAIDFGKSQFCRAKGCLNASCRYYLFRRCKPNQTGTM